MASDWSKTTLGEICVGQGGSIHTGPFGSQLHASDYQETGIPVVMPTNICDGRILKDGIARIGQIDADRLGQHKLDLGDVVFSRRGDVTLNALIGKQEVGWLCGTGCLKVRLGNESRAKAKFISYCLRLPETKEWLVRHAVGATMPNLNTSILSAVPMILPPIAIQEEISGTLSALDDKIILLREANATLEAIVQALFKSWFVDFDPVRARTEGRDPEGMPPEVADLFPNEFEESELGAIPKGWRVGTIGELVSLRNERTKPGPSTESLPYVPIECITSKCIFLGNSKPGSEAQSSLILFKSGDILFGAMRPYFHKVCLAPWDGVTRTTAFVCRPRESHYQSFALLQLFRVETIEFATTHSEGSTIPYAKWVGSMDSMKIVIPHTRIAQAFSEIVNPLIDRGIENTRQSAGLGDIRDTLLPRLMSGKLRTTEVDGVSE